MAFVNTYSSIVIDSKGDIYNFKLTTQGVELIVHEKSRGGFNKSLVVEGKISEYDLSINQSDEIDIICKKYDGSLSIYSLSNGSWIESKILQETDGDICGVKILAVDESKHIFYYKKSTDDSKRLNIYHHYIKRGKWSSNLIKDVYRSPIIKPIEIIKDKGSLTIGYYDLGENSEDIFIQMFDIASESWGQVINVTNDAANKLYLDLIKIDDHFHIAYSEYEDENLIIKHRKLKISSEEVELVSEETLSNQTNCTYPTFVYATDVLWITWTEYESVVSAYSKDQGDTWSSPYVWSESKKGDFIRCKFETTKEELKENYKMNYSFSKTYPELSFLGFGNLSGATELIKKKMNLRMR